ncbi:MAG: hypothetical protein ACPG7F_00735 [Aggregatilineales bacterium]
MGKKKKKRKPPQTTVEAMQEVNRAVCDLSWALAETPLFIACRNALKRILILLTKILNNI